MTDRPVRIRPATDADLPLIRDLWEAFEREIPEPIGEPEPWSEAEAELREGLDAGILFVADGGEGFAHATGPIRGVGRLEIVYVRPAARRRGVARELVLAAARELSARGATDVLLEVVATNDVARATWDSLGFEVVELGLAAPIARLVR